MKTNPGRICFDIILVIQGLALSLLFFLVYGTSEIGCETLMVSDNTSCDFLSNFVVSNKILAGLTFFLAFVSLIGLIGWIEEVAFKKILRVKYSKQKGNNEATV